MTCSRCGGEWCAVDEFDEQARGAFDDCAATQLEQMRRDLADLRARGVVPDADCTCGSGGHPRPCAKHPHRMEMHAREIDAENALEQMRRERDEARATKAIARWQEAVKDGREASALRKRMDERVQRERLAPFVARIAELERERDEARAHAEERTAKVRDLARCAAASEARARAYAAKLERVREVVLWRYDSMTTACEALADVLRIIDEKEGGQ